MSDAVPTELEIANAGVRAAIAAKQNQQYDEAQALADAALEPGYHPWMALHLIDADHRQNGNTQPVATVFKVYRGEEKLTERSMFIRKMPDHSLRTATSYEPLFGDLLTEPHPTRTIEVKGQQTPVGRYELCWSALERYSPRSAESLAASRERRQEKAVEREAERMPLFQNAIREEGYVQKPRRRT